MTEKKTHTVIYFLPFFLLLTTFIVFHVFTQWVGQKPGYFLGFIFYWFFWCLTIPALLIGKKALAELFKDRQPIFGKHKTRNILLLLLPLVFVYSYELPKALKEADALIILASAGLSIVNAIAEELLWRGSFLKIMGRNSKWYIPFSSFGFAIWHFAPLSVIGNHNPGGSLSFVAVSFILGLLYSTVTRDSNSILLVTISHILFDFSGLGGRIYF